MKRIALVAALGAGFIACKPHASRSVRVHLPEGVAASDVRVEPTAASRAVDGGDLVVVLAAAAPTRIAAPGACAVTVTSESDVTLAAAFEVPRHRAPLGWDRDAVIDVRFGCPEAAAGEVTWEEREGHLVALVPLARGARVRVRTEPFAAATDPAALPWGIVPISPRTQGHHVLTATWRGPDGATQTRVVELNAAARATGIPSLATGQEVFVRGDALTVSRVRPPEAAPVLERVTAGLYRFRADVPSQTLLLDRDGHPLSIRAGTHEHVPLDCGRGECHAEATRAAETSPMTHVLRNGLEGALGDAYDPSCAVACHAAGEPGLADEGFVAVASGLGVGALRPRAGAWNALPRALRRLGGVTCTSCHGPAAIPEPTARFAALRADVCAVCHDAPPRYGHVAAWRTSKMAVADRDDEAARTPACQRCHTTAGFLRSLSPAPREEPPAYANARPIGIACAACHAPHGAHVGALVRDVPVPAAFTALDGASRICVACHADDAARVWAGDDGAARAHGNVGCASCHLGGDRAAGGSEVHGAGHAFIARRDACATCHEARAAALEADASAWIARARAALGVAESARPLHARANWEALARADATTRALAAIVTDRGAYVHNAPFVRAAVLAAEAGPRH